MVAEALSLSRRGAGGALVRRGSGKPLGEVDQVELLVENCPEAIANLKKSFPDATILEDFDKGEASDPLPYRSRGSIKMWLMG